jgi:hypothetical protein
VGVSQALSRKFEKEETMNCESYAFIGVDTGPCGERAEGYLTSSDGVKHYLCKYHKSLYPTKYWVPFRVKGSLTKSARKKINDGRSLQM